MATVDGLGAVDVLAAVAHAVADGADLIDLVNVAPERTAEVVSAARAGFPSLLIGVAARGREDADAAIAAGADMLTGQDLAVTDHRVGVVCTGLDEAERCHTDGVAVASILVDVTLSPDPLKQADELAAAGWAVLTTCEKLVGDGPDATLAATVIAAASGVRVFRTRQVKRIRRTVDMVASIAGTRPPASVLRALA